MSSLLYLVGLLRSLPEIPQRCSSKVSSYCTFLWELAKSCLVMRILQADKEEM